MGPQQSVPKIRKHQDECWFQIPWGGSRGLDHRAKLSDGLGNDGKQLEVDELDRLYQRIPCRGRGLGMANGISGCMWSFCFENQFPCGYPKLFTAAMLPPEHVHGPSNPL